MVFKCPKCDYRPINSSGPCPRCKFYINEPAPTNMAPQQPKFGPQARVSRAPDPNRGRRPVVAPPPAPEPEHAQVSNDADAVTALVDLAATVRELAAEVRNVIAIATIALDIKHEVEPKADATNPTNEVSATG